MKIKRYIAHPSGPITDEIAALLGPKLTKIAEKEGGMTSERFLELVRDGTFSEVEHLYNGWDVEAAAELHWRSTSSLIMRTTMVVIDHGGEEITTRALETIRYVPKQEDEPAENRDRRRIFMTAGQVTDNPEVAEWVIQRAAKEVRIWANRYNDKRKLYGEFAEKFDPVFEAIEELEVAAD